MSSSETRLALVMLCLLGSPAAGAEPVRLTHSGLFKRDTARAPGGTGIIFTERLPAGTLRPMYLNLKDGKCTEYLKSGRELAISANGQVVAFTSGDGLGCSVEVNDQRNGGQLSFKGNFASSPAVAPDGQTVVFSIDFSVLYAYDLRRARDKNVRLEIKDKQAPGLSRLTPADVSGDYQPAFSTDGRQVVFASRRDNDFEIYRMKADGSEQRRLTHSPGLDINPVFSPDGKQIAFTSNRAGNYEIYVMDVDGANVRRLTNHPERDDFACWLPDGNLVIISERQGKYDLYRVNRR